MCLQGQNFPKLFFPRRTKMFPKKFSRMISIWCDTLGTGEIDVLIRIEDRLQIGTDDRTRTTLWEGYLKLVWEMHRAQLEKDEHNAQTNCAGCCYGADDRAGGGRTGRRGKRCLGWATTLALLGCASTWLHLRWKIVPRQWLQGFGWILRGREASHQRDYVSM